MQLEIKPGEALSKGITRNLNELAGDTARLLKDRELDIHETVHETRKNFKRIRALLRMVRLHIGEEVYQRENVRYRDLGRAISEVRDATALLELIEKIEEGHGEKLAAAPLLDLKDQLLLYRKGLMINVLNGQAIRLLTEELEKCKSELLELPLKGNDFILVEESMAKVYQRGKEAMEKNLKAPTDESMHDWRKRVKYLLYQLEILLPIWPSVLTPFHAALDELSDLLGKDHDLSVLREKIKSGKLVLADEGFSIQLLVAAHSMENILQKNAKLSGRRIYAEPAGNFVARLRAYWECWQDQY